MYPEPFEGSVSKSIGSPCPRFRLREPLGAFVVVLQFQKLLSEGRSDDAIR